MILPVLYISEATGMGRGVFTSESLPADTVVEIAPVIVMRPGDQAILDKTLLHDYIFEWGEERDRCAVALGYVSVYNHAFESNCEYEMDFEAGTITVRTICAVQAGDQLFINYNGDWNDTRSLWFLPK